jgi:hypothetical protein
VLTVVKLKNKIIIYFFVYFMIDRSLFYLLNKVKLIWRSLDDSISFETEDFCRWKRFSKEQEEPTLFSFVSSSPNGGLVLVSQSNEDKLYAKLSQLTYKSGVSPEDVRFQFEGRWQNGLTLKEIDSKLSLAKETCSEFYLTGHFDFIFR